ncbi:sulfotransferase domain-containing protein [Candidatus Laterigemmans baculatus]|uniref:sulfotransferase domain-containing protein n=1 Tax=Candidatus Laterigemmans baculatus TaxID=2770505 RepID=UPI0013DD3255|nr:sulfotransferase domain-containing protein [Candidatus Laterigemmans baculatus]
MIMCPNFLYIGTSKAGSTWIFKLLQDHPEIYTAPGKGTYYFCAHYDRGWDWYQSQFAPSRQHLAVGEISHTYMASSPACRRIAQDLPEVKLIACVRDPVERAFSDYLDGVKNGRFAGSFEDELERVPELIDIGRYGTQLQRYLNHFPREQIHVALFDDLATQPVEFSQKIYAFLEVQPRPIAAGLQNNKLMPAGVPRSKRMAQMAKRVSKLAKRAGVKKIVGRVKTSAWIRNLLYRQYTPETKPKMRPETRQRLRELFAPEVARLDHLLGTQCARTWNYEKDSISCRV